MESLTRERFRLLDSFIKIFNAVEPAKAVVMLFSHNRIFFYKPQTGAPL
ncbi:MAG: hypothetical protein ACJASW_001509 [Polaribacter sp.]|jgi:hypothetical protein